MCHVFMRTGLEVGRLKVCGWKAIDPRGIETPNLKTASSIQSEKLTKSQIRTWQSSWPTKQTRQDTDDCNYEKTSHKARDSLNQGGEQPSWGVAAWHSGERLGSTADVENFSCFFSLASSTSLPPSDLSVSHLLVIMTNKGDEEGASGCQILEYL